jgi:hypothetical protein
MRLVAVSLLLVLAACAPKPEIVAPVYSIGAKTCSAEIDISTARPISFNAEEPEAIEVRIDGSSPCVEKPGSERQLYQLIQLPVTSTPYLVSIGSKINGSGIFAPVLLTLDSEGNAKRQIDQSSFLFRGSSLTAKIQSQPDEHFLVIASNPASVGDTSMRIDSLVNSHTTYSNGFAYRVNTGHETRTNVTFSHSGLVSVSTHSLPNRSISAR